MFHPDRTDQPGPSGDADPGSASDAPSGSSGGGAPLAAAELRAWKSFLAASHLLEQEIERQLKADGELSHADFEILVTLREADERRLRMTDLARRAMISKSRLTYQITQLEQRGLVRRTPCPTDRRAVWAQLTAEGEERLARVRPGHRSVVRRHMIGVLSAEELDVLGTALTRVADNLRDTGR
ncbi:MarR family winged helix-turn-helix transcriptional regulator [Actinomadura harenae]|uniref:MarR family transcriptional regulator n=1 Tax=Actinomadura harenae TaxID=2483351 RepID=A0A3M2M3L6_9ACTN|nr:MarR family transcriptional regulator [Actinomadura harenae]RMI44364.1 MarR family transcriptional regulator [Actinomadura harenae]